MAFLTRAELGYRLDIAKGKYRRFLVAPSYAQMPRLSQVLAMRGGSLWVDVCAQ